MPTYKKPVIRSGTFHLPQPGGKTFELSVDAARMNRWIEAFRAFRASGNKISLTHDHLQSVEAVIGEVTELSLNAAGELEAGFVTDRADLVEGEGKGEVSIELDRNVILGNGRRFAEAVTAVSIVRRPVVAGQLPAEKIAASLAGIVESENPLLADATRRLEMSRAAAAGAGSGVDQSSTGNMLIDDAERRAREWAGLRGGQ